MKPIATLCAAALLGLAQVSYGQTLETLFSASDLVSLEQLINAAQANDAEVLETLAQIEVLERSSSFEGRLTDALTIQAGAELEGDFYNQASPSYSISISLNVMELVASSDTRRILDIQLARARAQARVSTVQAFVDYKVAVNAAEAAARAVEASEAAFHVTAAQYTVGDAILANQISAQTAVADAAVRLLSTNGQVIVALEQLATVSGLTPAAVATIVGDHQQASH
jgi:outer membrane protein TolC